MKSLKYCIIIMFFLILSSSILSSQTSYNYDDLIYKVNINKNVFEVNEPIEINNVIENLGVEAIGIEVSDISTLNYDYVVYMLNGRVIEKSMKFYENKERTIEQLNIPRKEILYPEEQYGQIVNLNQYYDNLEPGRYILEPIFFPLTNMGDSYPHIKGKKLQIQIVPIPYKGELEPGLETSLKQYTPFSSAFDTIDFVLDAKLKSDWDAFFAYFDLSKIISLFNKWYIRYNDLPKSKRDELLEEFKEYLRENFEKSMMSYDVVRSFRDKTGAIVIAEIYRMQNSVVFTTRYTFYLEKRKDFWIIVNYELTNLGS